MSEADVAPESTPCDRCGTFAPLTKRGSQMLCDACLERTKHEIETTPFTSREVLSGTFTLLRAVGPAAFAVGLVAGTFDVAVWYLGHRQVGLHGPGGLLHLLALAAVLPLCHGVVALLGMGVVIPDAPKGIVAALREARSHWGVLVFADFVRNLYVGLYTLLFIVPGIRKALELALVTPLAASGAGKTADVLDESERRMKHHRMAAFVPALLFALPAAAVEIFGLVARFLPGVGPHRALTIIYASPIVIEPLMVPVTLMTVVLFAKTRPVGEEPVDTEPAAD